jgi:predicted Fe-Mo cluster-binding NifX family protein
MKIAVVTDDGTTLAQHFGRARYYQVWTVEDGSVTGTELRDRAATLRHGNGHEPNHEHEHGTHDHSAMVAQITDVELVLAGGMGFRARQAMDEAGITVVATDIAETEAAVAAWIDGTLTHREERLH